MDDRQQLLEILARRSFRLGQFQLSSGGTSDYYIDCRITTLDAEGARLTGQVFLQALQALQPEAVGGLTMGADPIVVSVAVQSAAAGHPINGFLVRKAEKAHGTGKRIEGTVRAGMRVAIVDDVCTTAASTISAIEAAWQAELDVVGVLCLVEREEADGQARLHQLFRERLGRDCPFQAMFTARDVRAVHERQLKENA